MLNNLNLPKMRTRLNDIVLHLLVVVVVIIIALLM